MVVFGSGVEVVTCAVFVIQPLPFPPTEVVIVKIAVAPEAIEASSQRTMRVALAYVQPGAEVYDRLDGDPSARSDPLLQCSTRPSARRPAP